MALTSKPSLPSDELRRQFRYMLNAAGEHLTKSDCLKIAYAEELPKHETDSDSEEFRVALLHELYSRGLFNALNPGGLLKILEKVKNAQAIAEVKQYMSEQRYKTEKECYNNKIPVKKRKKVPLPEDIGVLYAIAQATMAYQTTALDNWENNIQQYNSGECEFYEVTASLEEYSKALKRSIRFLLSSQKNASASSLTSCSSNESDSHLELEAFRGVRVPAQEVHEQQPPKTRKRKPIPLPRTKRSQSLSLTQQPTITQSPPCTLSATSPTPLPRSKPSPPPTPSPRSQASRSPPPTPLPTQDTDTQDDFTGGTGDSGMGTGESDRLTWIKGSQYSHGIQPAEEGVYELVCPLPETCRYTPLLTRRENHSEDGYTEPMRTASIDQLLVALKEMRRRE